MLFAALSSLWLRQLTVRADAGHLVLLMVPWGLFSLWSLRCRPPSLWLIVALGCLVRTVFVSAPPWLSDDVYRYLAEGHALNHGENPFLVPPAHMQSISEALRGAVNHPTLTTLYPPIALTWFRLIDILGGTVAVAQGLTALVDLSVIVAISRMAGRRWALLYALHPLGPIEGALGAHIDILAVAFAAWGVVLARRRPALAATALVLGCGTKLLPGVLLIALWVHRDRGKVALGSMAGGVLCLLAALPIVDAGPALLHSLTTYSTTWSFNSLALPIAQGLLGSAGRPALYLLGAAVVATAVWRRADERATWALVGAGFLLLTPTAHPWYALWVVVPTLMLGRAGWLAASTALMGSYAVLWSLATPNGWTESAWLMPATWGPALLLLAAFTWKRKAARRQPSQAT